MSWELKLKNPQTDRQKKSPQHRRKDKELECSKEKLRTVEISPSFPTSSYLKGIPEA